MNIKYLILPFLSLFSFPLFGQNIIDPASLPDIESYAVVRTNLNADTIIIALHGGPTDVLFDNTFSYLKDIPTFSVVEVMKLEMLRPILFDSLLTLEEANAVNDTSAALVEKAIQHYKNEGKTIVLVGHSWGAFILGEYMDDYGVSQVDKIIPMEGRLNMQQEYIDYLHDGYVPRFAPDGVTIVTPTPPNTYPHGLITLIAAIFENRWVDSLANTDLSNLMYSYGEFDQSTGALTTEEIDFLNQSGAQINFIPEGEHGESLNSINQEIIVDFIREPMTTSIERPLISQNHVRLFPTLAEEWIQLESDQPGLVEIYSTTGQLVLRKDISNFPLKLNITNLSMGQYVAIIRSSLGGVNTARFQVFR